MALKLDEKIGPAGARLKGAALNSYRLLVRQFMAGNGQIFREAYEYAERAQRNAGPSTRGYWNATMRAAQAGAEDWT